MITLRRVVITALLAFAVALLWWATTQDAEQGEPEAGRIDSAVEEVVPGNGDAALRQGEIGVDLVPGWTAALAVDGHEIPEDQLRRNDPLNQVFFTPGEGREIEELAPGPHVATALIWRPTTESREQGRTVTWRFRVS
jgi:hypothetical protein